MSNSKNNDPSMFITSTHRIIFPHLDAPHKFEDEDGKEDNEPKYDITLLIPYNHPDAVALMGAMQQIHQSEAMSKFKGIGFDQMGQPDGIWNPLRVGDHYADKMIARGKDPAMYETYRGHYFIKATSGADKQPIVFKQVEGQPEGPGRHEVIDIKREIYGGCYARGVFKIMAWATKHGKYGFSLYINSVLKTAEGPKLGGFSANASDYDFGQDATDRTALLPGEAPAAQPQGFAMPMPSGAPRVTTPGVPPTMPAGVPPAAQRPQLPSMTPPAVPGAGAFTPPAVTPPPAYSAPVMQAPPAFTPSPVAQPMYNVDEASGRQIVSYDGGANWEWA